MGDTQRSQTISTDNQGIAAQVARNSSKCSDSGTKDGAPLLVGECSLVRIEQLAQAEPDMVFTSLAHRIDLSLLRKSFRQLRKNESTGVDKVRQSSTPRTLKKTSIIYINGCVEVSTLHHRSNASGLTRRTARSAP